MGVWDDLLGGRDYLKDVLGLSDEDIARAKEEYAKMLNDERLRPPREDPKPGSGQIFIDGQSAGSFRHFFGYGDMGELIGQSARVTITGTKGPNVDIEGEGAQKLVQVRIWEAALEAFEHPLDIQFTVGYNPGEKSWWFTARYFDDDAGEELVKMTLEVTATAIESGTWDDFELSLERKMNDIKDKFEAELAMFE